MVQVFCQWALLIMAGLAFLGMMKKDIEGAPAKQPQGFEGVVISIIAIAIQIALLYGAGALDSLFGQR